MATKVIVNIPDEAPYAVRIGEGVIADLGRNLRDIPRFAQTSDVLVITDGNVAPLYLAPVRESLTAAGFKVADAVVDAGEETKSVEVAAELWSALARLAFGRDGLIVALGGGVVGDLAGFVAATYMRGVPVVQVPTTLLAMVDSSVGGKTAVNLPEGKNLVGVFYQPSFVCADTATLTTLPEREWQCGCAEVAKSAAIDSDEFFFWLCEQAPQLAARNPQIAAEAIKRCVVFKADVVARDKTESAGVRECLNFGHTLGHAIESVAGYGAFSHGAAVAEGMRFASSLNAGEDSSAEFAEALGHLLDTLGLPAMEWRAPAPQLLDAMRRDKKNRGGDVRFVLADDVGRWRIEAVGEDRLMESLEAW